jgi:nucleoside-diphosphate-sugar epimerase
MNILITGGTGFIGNSIVSKLKGEGHDLFLLLRDEDSALKITDVINECSIIYSGSDISRLDNNLKSLKHIDVVVHAATDYGRNENYLILPIYANLLLPLKLLQFCIKNSVSKFINLDTFFNIPNTNYDYLKSYTLTKKQFLEWGIYFSNKMNFINLKLFHVYGPNDNSVKFVPSLIKKCMLGESIDLTSGSQMRDFIYLDDVVKAVCMSVSAPLRRSYHNFDIGTGKLTSIKDFVMQLNTICGSKSALNFGALQDREGELINSFANLKMNTELGWKFDTDIKSGLKKIISDYKYKHG